MAADLPQPPSQDSATPTTGDYAAIGGKQAVQTGVVYKGLEETTKGLVEITPLARPLTGVFRVAARRAPVIGAVISAAQDYSEIKGDLKDSKFGKAGVATVAATLEVTGNLVGFGVGDGAREVVRTVAMATGGDNLAIDKSDLRNASETIGAGLAAMKDKKQTNPVKLAQDRTFQDLVTDATASPKGTSCKPPADRNFKV